MGWNWPVFGLKCSKDVFTEYSLYSGGSGDRKGYNSRILGFLEFEENVYIRIKGNGFWKQFVAQRWSDLVFWKFIAAIY